MTTQDETTQPAYDAWQTTFFFSLASNDVSGTAVQVALDPNLPKGEALRQAAIAAAAELTATLKADLDGVIAGNNSSPAPFLGAGDWTVVWGPQVLCLYPMLGSVKWAPYYTARFNATNAVFVVFSQQLGRYIAAIAATNFNSIYDWFAEDFNVSSVVAWEGALQVWNGGANTTAPSAGIPCISQATCTGVNQLLSMVDTVLTQKTLIGFLSGLTPAAGTTLTFTGHSLAGALSPTLAMACFDPAAGLLKGSGWTAAQAMIYPTAGATPGNASFAALINGTGWAGASEKGNQPWQVWNTDIYNNVDVVPHAWGASTLEMIPEYYSVYYGPKVVALIQALVNVARDVASKGEAVAGPYTAIGSQVLNPTGRSAAGDEFVYLYTIPATPGYQEYLTIPQAAETQPAPVSQTQVAWPDQALFQHTTAYSELILQTPPQPVSVSTD
jgi:hypothetical protein